MFDNSSSHHTVLNLHKLFEITASRIFDENMIGFYFENQFVYFGVKTITVIDITNLIFIHTKHLFVH